MVEVIAGIVVVFLAIRTGVAALNWWQHPGLNQFGQVASQDLPLISILIPARNEALTLPHLLPQLLKPGYPNLEILVLNDQSEDETASLLAQFEAQDKRFRAIEGKALPSGWLGKNWACHQLAHEAKGRYFLFLDADIHALHPQALSLAVGGLRDKSAALLSVFPDQLLLSTGERMVVPLMHYLLLSLLPLRWIWQLPFPSMAAANGQFMLFDGEKYRQYLWHEQARDCIVEDIAIVQLIKKNRQRAVTVVADGWVSCRMYRSFGEGIQGFSKNLLAGFGNSVTGMLIYLFLVVFGGVFVVWGLPIWAYVGYLALIVLERTFISVLARQGVLNNLILHPVQMGVLVILGVGSIYKKLRGRNTWKGRNVQLSSQR